MRPIAVVAALLALPVSHAAADRTGGGSGGGGPLSHVSSGISSASHAGSSGSSSDEGSSGTTLSSPCDACVYPYHDVGAESPEEIAAAARYTGDRAHLDLYAGLQKVHDSDGSWTIEAAVTDYRFRLTGAVAHYFEARSGGDKLSMSMPSVTVGMRIDDMGATAVFVQGGVVHAGTSGDLMADSSITGPVFGLRVEHTLARRVALIGDAASMWFGHDIHATGARVGLRLGPVEGSLRVLDFNVGPPLYGPELGLRF